MCETGLGPMGTMGTAGLGNGTRTHPWVPVPENLLSMGDSLQKFHRYQYPRVRMSTSIKYPWIVDIHIHGYCIHGYGYPQWTYSYGYGYGLSTMWISMDIHTFIT